MGTFFFGYLLGFLTIPLLMFLYARKQKKSGMMGLIGVAKTSKDAADKVMQMLNSSPDVRDDVKNRLGVD